MRSLALTFAALVAVLGTRVCATGLYFLRLAQGAQSRTVRFAVLR